MPASGPSHWQTAIAMVQTTADGSVAVAALTMPIWRHSLHEWSVVAADVAPFFAILWLLVQIVAKIIETRIKVEKADDD